jgi:hypothetical protein
MRLTKIYDSRNLGELTEKKPLVLKAEFIDNDGITYFGWKYVDDTQAHYNGYNHMFFQSCLANGKKCQRKVSARVNKKLLSVILNHMQENKIVDWYLWPSKIEISEA